MKSSDTPTEKPEFDPEEKVEGLTENHLIEFAKLKTLFFIVFFILGLINNNAYVLINSGAQSLAKSFNKKDLMPTFQMCLIVFSGLMRVFNSKFLLKWKHKLKISIAVTLSIVAYLIFFGLMWIKNNNIGFSISLFATLIFGAVTTIGSMTVVGFMKGLPPKSFSGWGSGTGFAGISGAGISLLIDVLGIEFGYACIGLIPFSFVYLYLFFLVVKKKAQVDKFVEKKTLEVDNNDKSALIDQEPAKFYEEVDRISLENQQNLTNEQQRLEQVEDAEAGINQQLTFKIYTQVMKVIGWEIWNISIVYFLEYMCCTSFADRANPKSDDPNQAWLQKNAFKVLSLSYQVGVFISRSSFTLFKFRRVGLLSFLQAVNFVLFLMIAYFKNVSVYIQVVLMVFVGLMGGTSYVNCMYLILSNKVLKKSEKEIAVNITGVFNDVGIFGASVGALVVSNYILPSK